MKLINYHVHTFGCQMNVHDSERIKGILDKSGYIENSNKPDIVVFNTCAVRENAANKLYGHLGIWKSVKKKRELILAVGGCLAQKEKGKILEKAPWVDIVFGTHNAHVLPKLIDRANYNKKAQIEIVDSLQVFPSHLPAKRELHYSAYVVLSVGCNNTCTFCIVPSLRGKEQDRPYGEILGEIQSLVQNGVVEITLLGQNVNSYGVQFGERNLFTKLLLECRKIEGLKRVRFTSPHPRDFTTDVIDAISLGGNLAPQIHMPLQSGSDRVLKLMRRSYRRKKFLGIIDDIYNKVPNIAISTDIIVGFPGETEEDFEETLDIVKRVRFASAYIFKYSKRHGTPAASMDNQISAEVMSKRFNRIHKLQEDISKEENEKLINNVAEVMVSNKKNITDILCKGNKDKINMYSGRAFDGRLVHFESNHMYQPGDIVNVKYIKALSYYLVGSVV